MRWSAIFVGCLMVVLLVLLFVWVGELLLSNVCLGVRCYENLNYMCVIIWLI